MTDDQKQSEPPEGQEAQPLGDNEFARRFIPPDAPIRHGAKVQTMEEWEASLEKPAPQPPGVSGGEPPEWAIEAARRIADDVKGAIEYRAGRIEPLELNYDLAANAWARIIAAQAPRVPAAGESALDGPCCWCHEQTVSVAANPDKWPLRFWYKGEIQFHHVGCVTHRLADWEKEMDRVRTGALAVPAPAAERMTEADGGFVRWCAECGQHRPLSHKHPVPAEPGGGDAAKESE